ncbi:MAG: polysaccharide biosynthesis/export family protein [Rhodobacteraceae bacterium]|nr:polysaccharide biosynthesis/export family protein [Paracoccaceae bacterium]
MTVRPQNRARVAIALAAILAVTGCALPRTGPTKDEIYEGSVQRQGDAYIVEVNERVTAQTSVVPALGFSSNFRRAGVVGSDTIQPGDNLGLQIWENVDDGLLSARGLNQTALNQVQVDGDGFIFVPYAGRIKASGNTPEQVRRLITERLATQTPDPQVLVSRLAGDGATVSIIGGINAQGVYPIERPTRTLTAMLARAGGVSILPEIAEVTVTRGNQTGTVWLQDLYENPGLDIALRGGDRILVEVDQRAFTALGATAGQTRVPFDTQTISALEALARVGGLSPLLADPTGIFIFRNEEAAVANAVLGRTDLQGEQRMVYVLNLTEPNGMFEARDFAIRDNDTVYVTEAPYTQFTKILSAFSSPLTTAASFNQLFGG